MKNKNTNVLNEGNKKPYFKILSFDFAKALLNKRITHKFM